MKKSWVLACLVLFPAIASAGVYSNDFGKCLVAATSQQDRQNLVVWIFSAFSLNPAIRPYANISDKKRVEIDKQTARLFERLVEKDCRKQARAALKYEGRDAFKNAFGILGRIAGRQIMASPQAAAGMAGFTRYLDRDAIRKALPELAGPP